MNRKLLSEVLLCGVLVAAPAVSLDPTEAQSPTAAGGSDAGFSFKTRAYASDATGNLPPSGSVTTGEQEQDGAGPRTGYVDPAHATPAAARASAHAAHHPPTGTDTAGMDTAGSSVPQSGATTTASAPASMTATALDPAVFGQWQTLSYKLPLRAVHVTLLRTGKFLLIAGSGNVASDAVIESFKAYLWDPSTNALTSVPVPYDAFCAGHVVDRNGDVLVFGGTSAYKTSTTEFKGSDQIYKFQCRHQHMAKADSNEAGAVVSHEHPRRDGSGLQLRRLRPDRRRPA